ncbi:hypothetical protein LMG28688_01390 [Paraburkholderia caffeinitolerans]|uniref:Uncharacterized protein n=1 Tax=Paraburkholderia caffeinitolerans TaxID=1723730 RepID=A0A6J5FK28_9BURK|nr:hypothetical protein LMG28688_01390 [Paraburkholderia caffeinitolerans]CAB3802527.1 hypothetical protein LMG28690_05595 [Paraburkholderia caffeinilytica]
MKVSHSQFFPFSQRSFTGVHLCEREEYPVG